MNYRKLTQQLIARVRELEQEVADCIADCETSLDYALERQSQVEGRLHADLRQAEHERNQARSVNSNRQFDRDHTLRDLETACRRGDDWGQRRAINRLRDL